MKKILIFAMCVLVSACGGGGGGGSGNPSTNGDLIGASTQNLMPGMATGDFVGDGGVYVIVSGWLFWNFSFNDAPVKIYKVNVAGGGSDVTSQIIGSNIKASTHVPLVADFNGDRIDDIFLPGFYDTPVGVGQSYAFISQRGTTHRRVTLPQTTWSHDATVVDIDRDGDIDVVNSVGQMWINDGHGNFTFRTHTYQFDTLWMNGNGICAGDFNNSGRQQIVITDLSINGLKEPIADTAIFELDQNINAVARHILPPPILDRKSTVEASHDYTCRVADINNDGLLDIVVFSRPWDSARNNIWTEERYIQTLINRGNFVFEDTSSLNSVYYQKIESDYIPQLKDFNKDGKIDLWIAPDLFLNQSGSLKLSASRPGTSIVTSMLIAVNNNYGLFYIKDNNVYFTKLDYKF